MIDAFLEWLDEFACGAEYLELVVFGGGEHDPGVVLVPVEVGDGVCEAAVHEEPVSSSAEDRDWKDGGGANLQLGRSVFDLLLRLLFADLAEIPERDATVVAGTRENGGVLRVPL